jgi:hypothetical protein
MGTLREVMVSGWFASTSSQLRRITAGGLILDSQVSQLVQAMATYSTNNPGFDPHRGSASAQRSDLASGDRRGVA